MIARSIYSLILLFSALCGQAQNHFQKVLELGSDARETGISVVEKDGQLYAMTQIISYELPKIYFTPFDEFGNVSSLQKMNDFGGISNCVHPYEEGFLFTGIDLINRDQSTLVLNGIGEVVDSFTCDSDSLLSPNISATTLYANHLISSKNSFNLDSTSVDVELCWLNLTTG